MTPFLMILLLNLPEATKTLKIVASMELLESKYLHCLLHVSIYNAEHHILIFGFFFTSADSFLPIYSFLALGYQSCVYCSAHGNAAFVSFFAWRGRKVPRLYHETENPLPLCSILPRYNIYIYIDHIGYIGHGAGLLDVCC